MPSGFQLGDFTFYSPTENAPLDRRGLRPARPLQGATPPSWVRDFVQESAEDGPAEFMWSGGFCGHGEPAYSVFDVVIDGDTWLECATVGEPGSLERLLARPAGSTGAWRVIFDRQRVVECASPSTGIRTVPAGEVAAPNATRRVRLAIGFEYPIDCDSAEQVSWFAVAALPAKGDPIVLADEELM